MDERTAEAYFDGRAEGYACSEWHVRYAEALVDMARPAPGDRVLDACTGTGFAAVAAARAVGPDGAVVGVDISSGMLAQAARTRGERPNIAYVTADANTLSCLAAGAFDLVLCSAGLLYLDHGRALPAWRRVLRPGGRLAFSTMRAGFPVGAGLFRDLAAEYGSPIPDPSAPLGDETRCTAALTSAGYVPERLVAGTVPLPPTDPYEQWRLHRYGSRRTELDMLPRTPWLRSSVASPRRSGAAWSATQSPRSPRRSCTSPRHAPDSWLPSPGTVHCPRRVRPRSSRPRAVPS